MNGTRKHINLLPKKVWKDAKGAWKVSRRLHLKPDGEGLFHCPVDSCDSSSYRSQRGCRKHVFTKHGWYFYFDKKPKIEDVLPEYKRMTLNLTKTRRSKTSEIPMFGKTCHLYVDFKTWLESPGGGGKGHCQADQIATKVLKYLKFCCPDDSVALNVPYDVVDYFVVSIACISDFIDFLKDTWKVGYAGIIGYLNSLSHLIDYRRMEKMQKCNAEIFIACEVYISRVKKTLTKKMRVEWNTVLSVEYLAKINCWATLEELENVIQYHSNRFSQIMVNAATTDQMDIPSHDLSFCTSYIVVVLFLLVKAARPMSFQHLTLTMLNNVDQNGVIDQTVFKTQQKYGFDTLIFSQDVLDIIKGYTHVIRPRLNPRCDYLLISRNGTQLSSLSEIFGKAVFQATGKYINPTRYRQIIETESAEKLNMEEQAAISEDQKHTSLVAKIHYKKQLSRNVAMKGKNAMDKLRDQSSSHDTIEAINNSVNFNIEHSIKVKETTSKQDAHVEQVPQTSHNNPEQHSLLTRKKKVPFSSIEDSFLKAGILRYGKGKWTNILNDREYKFHPSRKSATLFTRAKLCKYI